MTTAMHDGFLQDIIEHPDDDFPRLAYADWLNDQGDEARAEFIRVQCKLAKIGECLADYSLGLSCCCRFCCGGGITLRRRERELLKANFGAWTDFLPESFITKQCPWCVNQPADWETNVVECRQCECTGLVPGEDRVEFRRGFPAEIHCRLADWCGAECERCDGSGWVIVSAIPPPERDNCPACHGTGRVNSHGPAIVRVTPIERVEMTDREPWNNWSFTQSELHPWGWQESQAWYIQESYCLPPELFRRLDGWGIAIHSNNRGSIRGYATRDAALDAASTALITWAKAQPVR